MGTLNRRTTPLGLLISRFRGDRSRREYGETLGVSGQAVLKYERGAAVPSWSVLAAITADAGLSQDERAALFDLILQTVPAVSTVPATNPATNRAPE